METALGRAQWYFWEYRSALGLVLQALSIGCRSEPVWDSWRAACSGRPRREAVPVSAVMRLIKGPASWPGRAEQGLGSWGTKRPQDL